MKHVVIFARRPKLGRVKTRLAADIGPVETLRFYRATLNALAPHPLDSMQWMLYHGLPP